MIHPIRRIGVHVSISGGLCAALDWAEEIGSSAMQIFSHNPRGWTVGPIRRDEAEEFATLRAQRNIETFIHASYLINPVSSTREVREKSVWLLKIELDRADVLGVDFVVLHAGRATDVQPSGMHKRLLDAFQLLERTGQWKARLLLENTAGGTGDIGSSMGDLAQIVDMAGNLAGGVCIDTCHAHASGYDLATDKGLDRLMEELDRHIGLPRLKLIHLNDSKKPSGSGLDRHEHVGKGTIGEVGLSRLLKDSRLSGVPVILETPRENEEDDHRNLRRVRELMG